MCLHWNYICVADICHYSLEFQPILTGKNQKRRSESKPHNHIRCQSAFVYSRQTKSPSVKVNTTKPKGKTPECQRNVNLIKIWSSMSHRHKTGAPVVRFWSNRIERTVWYDVNKSWSYLDKMHNFEYMWYLLF